MNPSTASVSQEQPIKVTAMKIIFPTRQNLEAHKCCDGDRFPEASWHIIALLMYLPFGILLAIVRFFMFWNLFVASIILSPLPSIRRYVLRHLFWALGLIINESNLKNKHRLAKTKIIVSNHITLFDFIPMHLLLDCQTVSYSYLPSKIFGFFGFHYIPELDQENRSKLAVAEVHSIMEREGNRVLIFPEGEITNGSVGLLRFEDWWYDRTDDIGVQPIALTVSRPTCLNIRSSILGSSWYTDCFWQLFVPYTCYNIEYLPYVVKTESISLYTFAYMIEIMMARKLRLSPTNLTWVQKREYEKTYRENAAEAEREKRATQRLKALTDMANEIRRILGNNIPLEIIMEDLDKTGNINDTVLNLMERRVVGYADTVQNNGGNENQAEVAAAAAVALPEEGPKSFKEMTLAEKKEELLKDARKRYLEKMAQKSSQNETMK